MAGFRSGNSQQVQCFDQLYQDFPLLSLERSITTLEDAPEKEESLGMSSVKTIFSAMEPSLLLNYLLLSLLEEKVPGDQVQLSSKSKYKLSFSFPDISEEQNVDVQVKITRKDRAIN